MEIGPSVRGRFREAGAAPTRKGSTAKARMVEEKYMLKIKEGTRRGAWKLWEEMMMSKAG
jgi:hypothetical protein